VKIHVLTHLFVKVHTYLDQETAKRPFRSLVKLPLVTNILTTKGRSNPVTYLQLKKQQVNLFIYF